MKKIILDTNVILKHLTSSNLDFGNWIVKSAKQGKIQLFTSELISLELKQATQYPQIKSRLNGQSAKFLAFLKYNSAMIAITKVFQVCRDPKDDKFLELAAEVQADFIITGDRDLLVLDVFQTTRIISPKEFLTLTVRDN